MIIETKNIHFIGIGGIGVSALAQYYLTKGYQVSGSDLASSEVTELLRKQRVKIFIGEHKENNLANNVVKVIYSPAVQENNPELLKAKKLGVQVLSYPKALGELTKEYYTIAISGTHGKSTTTSMVALILIKAGLDPTVIVGTKLEEFQGTNFRIGKSKYLVIEADEYKESFLNYWPKIIIINNIEEDHLDYYKNIKNILKAFEEFVGHLPQDGKLVINKDDKNIAKLKKESAEIINFSLDQPEAEELKKILKIPGDHNIYNALATLIVARILKIDDQVIFKALSEYNGCWRRFQIEKYKIPDSEFEVPLISDYAHHPTEVKALLSSVKIKFPNKNILAVFQPHQHQRTFYLFDEFVQAFDKADEVVITNIYDVAGREQEQISQKVNGEKLAKAIEKRGKKVDFIEDFKMIPQFLRRKITEDDVVLIIGAGDIYKIVDELKV